jgi:hypothetical protein
MSAVGQIERKTQDRVVALFQHTHGYECRNDLLPAFTPKQILWTSSL